MKFILWSLNVSKLQGDFLCQDIFSDFACLQMIFDTRCVGQTFANHFMASLSVGKMDKHRKLPNLRKDQTKSQAITYYKPALNPSPNSANK